MPGQDEIGVLSRALREMVDRLRRNQVELQRKQDQIERANGELTRANEDLHRSNEILEQLSFTDGLTHLHNHRYFQDRLRLEAKRADRSREPLALLLIDIDNFKWLNDRHGHAVGDEVLRRVATILNQAARETDLVARYGGEEFARARAAHRREGRDRRSPSACARRSPTCALPRARARAADGVAVTASVGVSRLPRRPQALLRRGRPRALSGQARGQGLRGAIRRVLVERAKPIASHARTRSARHSAASGAPSRSGRPACARASSRAATRSG